MATFCGLIAWPGVPQKERLPVPLKSVNVNADVRGWAVAVTADLCYENKLDENIECQFVFPLNDKSAVYRLEADVDGKKMQAELKPRKEAEETYRDAVDAGQTGMLMESQKGSRDVFRIMLGNLPAKKLATVTISYVQPAVREDDGSLTVVLPAVLNPRYVPEHMITDAEKMKEHFHFKVPYVAVSEVQYTMNFSAKICLGVNSSIAEIQPSNDKDTLKISYEGDEKLKAKVELDGNFVQDHDFGLSIVPKAPFEPMVFIEPGIPVKDGDKKWINFDIATAWFEAQENKNNSIGAGVEGDEYWLVIDRSGSMGGQKIKDAKTALVLFVKSLPVGCKFNIVGFGSNFETLFKEGSVNYVEETINKAVQYASNLDANMGGTEIKRPLEYIYGQSKPNAKGARQFIILLTDGEVGNTEEVINLAKSNASSSRVFTIGIGEGASSALVNGLARVSGGISEFVRSEKDRLQAKVISLLKATTNAAADNVKIAWNISGGTVMSYLPDAIPTAVYQGRPILQYALIARGFGNNADGSATLTATINGKPIEYKLPFNIASNASSESSDPMPLHRLAAKAKIEELTDQPDYRNHEEWCKKLVSISMASGVLCQETAFVAVDPTTKEELKDSNGKPRFIDVELPTQYAMPRMAMMSRAMPMMAMCMAAGPPSGAMKMQCRRAISSTKGRKMSMEKSSMAISDASMDLCDGSPSPPPMLRENAMDTIVRLQKFNGSWTFSDQLSAAIASPKASNANDLTKLIEPITQNKDAAATLATLAVLHHRFADRRDEWELIEQKAINFLISAIPITAAEIFAKIEAVSNALNIA